MRTLLTAAVALSGIVVGVHSQSPGTPVPGTFEAASVKANRSGEPGTSIRRQPGGRFNAVNAPLRNLITLAYAIQESQLVNVPEWAASERFDIVAKVEGDPPPMPPGTVSDPMLVAMRALLAIASSS